MHMNIGLVLLRLTLGMTIAAHSSQKLFGWFERFVVSDADRNSRSGL